MSVSEFMGVFKGQEQHDDIPEVRKYEICIPKQRILCKGFYVDTAGKNTNTIKENLVNQRKKR